MSHHHQSSGSLLADRRFAYAQALVDHGDLDAALDLMRQALELAPEWSLGWSALGDLAQRAGRLEQAGDAFRAALRLDPDDRAGAGLALAGLGVSPPPDQAPPAFVRSLFDQYAERFEDHLVKSLGYVAPQRLWEAVLRAKDDTGGTCTFSRALDLGCGTGLMGEVVRRHVSWLEGIDLSPVMLDQAARKGIYDQLHEGDLVQRQAASDATFDLVTAADVFNYIGDLTSLLGQLASALTPGGMLAFSVEAGVDENDVKVGPTRRYQHSRRYVIEAVAQAGLSAEAVEEITVRLDQGEDVAGLLVVASKPPRKARIASVPLSTLPSHGHDAVFKTSNEEEASCVSQTRLPS